MEQFRRLGDVIEELMAKGDPTREELLARESLGKLKSRICLSITGWLFLAVLTIETPGRAADILVMIEFVLLLLVMDRIAERAKNGIGKAWYDKREAIGLPFA